MLEKLYFYSAHVTSVYDGDTITVNIDLGFNMTITNVKVRLNGIDTAEIKSKDAILKEKAYQARDWLREQCLGKDVYLESLGIDKYGRCLAKIYLPDKKCLNDEMLANNLAVLYDGGKKNVQALIEL